MGSPHSCTFILFIGSAAFSLAVFKIFLCSSFEQFYDVSLGNAFFGFICLESAELREPVYVYLAKFGESRLLLTTYSALHSYPPSGVL